MKKIQGCILVLIVLMTSFTPAQAQANLWFGGGANFANMRIKYAGEVQNDNIRAGFNMGLYLSQSIGKNRGIETALVYDTKGYTSKYNDEVNGNITERFKPHYVDIYPVSFQYFYPLDEKQRIYGKTGPMIGIGLYGKRSLSGNDGYYEEEIDWAELKIERVDWGWNFSLGYEFNKALQSEIGYDMGIKNITDDTSEYLTLRNHCIKITAKISLSYLFAPVMEDGKFIKQKKKAKAKKKNDE